MLKPHEYFLAVRRPYPPFYVSMLIWGQAKVSNFESLAGVKFALCDHIFTNGEAYYSKTDIAKAGRLCYEALMDKAQFMNIVALLEAQEQKLIEASEGEQLTSFISEYESYAPSIVIAWTPEELAIETLRRLLTETLPAPEVEKLVGKLNMPLQSNFHKQEEYDLVTTNDLAEHVRDYAWIKSRYGQHDPYTKQEAEQKLAGIDKTKFLKEWNEEKEEIQEAVQQAKDILHDKAQIVDVVQFIVHYRTQRTDILNKASAKFASQLESEAKKRGLTYQQLLHCLQSEVLGQSPPLEVLEGRRKDHTVVLESGKLRCVYGEESREIAEYLREDVVGDSLIKGTAAQIGTVTGIVKIIISEEEWQESRAFAFRVCLLQATPLAHA